MRILHWLKRLRTPAEQASEPAHSSTAVVEQAELLTWFSGRIRTETQSLSQHVATQFKKIADVIPEIHAELDLLQEAELHNKNIPEKARQMMEGNREAFIQAHTQFLDRIHVPESITFKTSTQFCKDFEEQLEKLAKSTQRNNAILAEFFRDNLVKLNELIKQMKDTIDATSDELNDQRENVEFFDSVKQSIVLFQNKEREKIRLKRDLVYEQDKLASATRMKEKLDKDIDKLKSAPDYKQFEAMNAENMKVLDELKLVENDINHVFVQIEKPLKKYERMAVEDLTLVTGYLQNPSGALLEDTHLSIIDSLTKIKHKIQSGDIDVKNPDKMQERITALNKEFLQGTRLRYEELAQKKKQVLSQLKTNRFMMHLEDYNYRLGHTNEQIALQEQKVADLQDQMQRLNVETEKDDVLDAIERAVNVKVTIV